MSVKHLTEHELAARWNMDVTSLRAWRRTGKGCRFRKFGGAVRYAEADVVAFEEAATRQSTSDLGPANECGKSVRR